MSNYNDNDDVNDSDINQLMFIDTESTNFTEGGGGEEGAERVACDNAKSRNCVDNWD